MYVESLTYPEKKRYMKFAIISSCFGAVIQVAMSESSLFLLYASNIGAGKFLSLATTAIIPLMKLFFLIPFAYVMEKTGLKNFLLPAYTIGMLGMLTASSAGFFPDAGLYIFSIGVLVFAVSISGHSAGWFPLQRFIIPASERGAHFGKLRYSWQIVVSLFLLMAALVVDEQASVIKMQGIIAFGALLLIGRIYFVSRIPERPPRTHLPPFRVMLYAALTNRKLLQYSFFMFLVNLLISSTVPLGFAYLMFDLSVSDNLMVLFSVYSNIFTIAGFIIASKVIDQRSLQQLFRIIQIIFAGVNCAFLLFYLIPSATIPASVMLICLASASFAFCSVIVSAKMMGLTKENNINISMALCVGLSSGGMGLSRLISSLAIEYLPDTVHLAGTGFPIYVIILFAFGLGIMAMLAFGKTRILQNSRKERPLGEPL